MEFLEWKQKHGDNHLTQEMKDLIAEQEVLLAKDVHFLTEVEKQRLDDLKEFCKRVENMLHSEWQWFIQRILGIGGDYSQ